MSLQVQQRIFAEKEQIRILYMPRNNRNVANGQKDEIV